MKQASYIPLPELSPYISTERFLNPKQDFINCLKKIQETVTDGKSKSLLDVGCANGEFLYYLKQNLPGDWKLNGADFTARYLEVARSFPGLEGVSFEEADILSISGSYDVITCINVLQIFPEIETYLQKLLDITNDGGYLFLDGQFNRYDVDVIFQFRDNSKPEAEGKWRCDFNTHSQKRIAEFLQGKVKSFAFYPLEMGIDLPRKEDAPHINVFTLTLEDGRRIKTHGGNIILDSHLLVINK